MLPQSINASDLDDLVAGSDAVPIDSFKPLVVDGEAVGWLDKEFIEELRFFEDYLQFDADAVRFQPYVDSFEARSEVLRKISWSRRNDPRFGRWNDEYGCVPRINGGFVFRIPRCAVLPFGVRSCGAHVNGLVSASGTWRYWVSRRGANGEEFDGLLDLMSGGYIAASMNADETIVQEVLEETGLDVGDKFYTSARGVVSGIGRCEAGITPFTVYVYDLLLGPDEIPVTPDYEIAEFRCLEIDELVSALFERKFKFTAVPVIIDWLIRFGFVGMEGTDIIRLRSRLHDWQMPGATQIK